MTRLEELRRHVANTLKPTDPVDFMNMHRAIILIHAALEEMATRQTTQAYFWLGRGDA